MSNRNRNRTRRAHRTTNRCMPIVRIHSAVSVNVDLIVDLLPAARSLLLGASAASVATEVASATGHSTTDRQSLAAVLRLASASLVN
ncbi:MAG TPA: hypothetical protein VLA19_20525 [Herpetosiphonaceae bacterium]|nr:hypothetical protein [Herpetosiphonaceae bacterium]